MSRPTLPEGIKRRGVFIKLAPWIKTWLKAQGRSQGAIIEEALIKAHKLKEPQKG